MSTKTKVSRHDATTVNGTPAAGPSVQEKFAAARREMDAALIERTEEIDLALTALIANENVLLVGNPGTAKSLLADSLLNWMSGNVKKFSILVGKDTSREELFGMVDVMAMKESRYVRVTKGKLPEADLAFIDEIFKSSSAILNTLLKILNERTYENEDGTMRKVPLKLAIAASNEWPGDGDNGKELGALFDRFLLRKHVKPIASAEGRKRLLWERDHAPKFSTTISAAEIDQARTEAAALPWTDETKEAYESILRELAAQGINPGDRRQYKSVAVASAYAYLCGATEVKPEHLDILAHTLWDDPHEQPAKVAEVVGKIANPIRLKIGKHLQEVNEALAGVNMSDHESVLSSMKKLEEVSDALKAIPHGNGRVEKTLEYVRSEYKRLNVAFLKKAEWRI